MMSRLGKSFTTCLLYAISLSALQAQSYSTQRGFVEFSGKKPFEKVKAENNEIVSTIDPETGEVSFHAQIKSLHFKIAKMEDGFNKKYMESDKYPTPEFSGRIKDIARVDFKKDGDYPILVEGDLTIHNVTKKVTHQAALTVSNETLVAKSIFEVSLEDFNITSPTLLGKKMASKINVTVQMKYLRARP